MKFRRREASYTSAARRECAALRFTERSSDGCGRLSATLSDRARRARARFRVAPSGSGSGLSGLVECQLHGETHLLRPV